jgi:hypothetical protein
MSVRHNPRKYKVGDILLISYGETGKGVILKLSDTFDKTTEGTYMWFNMYMHDGGGDECEISIVENEEKIHVVKYLGNINKICAKLDAECINEYFIMS